MLAMFAKRQAEGSATCSASCNISRYDIERNRGKSSASCIGSYSAGASRVPLQFCVAIPYDRCLCGAGSSLTSECFRCLTGLNSVEDGE